MRFTIAGFVIPYMFVYGPPLLLIGTWKEITVAIVSAIIGTMALAASVQGWLITKANIFERILLLAGALMLIKPGIITDAAGLALLALVLGLQYARSKKHKKA